MNLGVVESTTVVSCELVAVLVDANASSASEMFTMVFGRSGGLRRELESCATRMGAGLGNFCDLTATCVDVFFFEGLEQEINPEEAMRSARASLHRAKKR